MEKREFDIDEIVTVDRYNHIDDVQQGIIVGFGTMPISNRLTYKINIGNTIIQCTGNSIVESEYYVPALENERHDKRPMNFKSRFKGYDY
jgi:hypothetical protein